MTDGVHSNALAGVAQRIHAMLDESSVEHKARVKRMVAEVLAVRLQKIPAKSGGTGVESTDIVEQVDERATRTTERRRATARRAAPSW